MDTGYTVEKVMTEDVLKVDLNTSILSCASSMANRGVGSAVILGKEGVAGIITEQDLVRKVLIKKLDTEKTPISEVMSKDPVTIEPERDIQDAMILMGNWKIKHLPVVAKNELLGIITFKDIVTIQPDLMDIMAHKNAMKTHQ